MKAKLLVIVTLIAAACATAGCSAEKVFKDKATGYQMNYDGTLWKVSKNTEVEEDFGTYTYSAVFNTIAKTEEGEPSATLKVLKEDLADFSVESDETALDDVASKLSRRLDDGIVSYQNATIAGLKGYWITVTPTDDTVTELNDIIFCVTDDAVYEFYYTAQGQDNYDAYESDINYMLYYFSEL
ncbi:MAG: hypothetical protein LUG66_07335 [Clostridiales bacterium]|nr:hypothetical protein [Clostridiales bacterium]